VPKAARSPSEKIRRDVMSRLSVSGVAVVALVAVMTPAPVNAVTYDKLASLTFNGPVQVPGVTLNAGTYQFRLANPSTSRNVLQVLSNDGATVYAMFHTRPDSRTTTTGEATVSFRETPAGVPAAVKSLFYGGEYHGYEFVYPKGGPIMIAEAPVQPAITYTRIPTPPIPERVDKPETELFVEPLEFAQAPEARPVEELPRTASPLPLVALGGLTSLLVGLGFGVLRRRHN
jgi:hypothetical protein